MSRISNHRYKGEIDGEVNEDYFLEDYGVCAKDLVLFFILLYMDNIAFFVFVLSMIIKTVI